MKMNLKKPSNSWWRRRFREETPIPITF